MQVEQAMQTRVTRVIPATKLREAIRIMLVHQIDGLPVVNDRNHLVGMLTCTDVLRFSRRHHPQAIDLWHYTFVIHEEDEAVCERLDKVFDRPVKQICSRDVITCHPTDHLADVAGLMVDHVIQRIPVVSDHGTLVGIISRRDVMRALWNAHAEK